MTIPASSYKITWRLTFDILFIMFAVPGTISSTSAQVGLSTFITIQGHITDKTGNPIPGATLTVKWTERETSSDEHGSFRIENVTEKDTVVIKHPGYKDWQFPIEKSKHNYFITLQKQTDVKSKQIPKTTTGELVDINGIVNDENGLGLPDALVVLKEQGWGSFTNHKGAFTLSHVPVNSTIIVSHINFFSAEFPVKKTESNYLLQLRKSPMVLSEIVITGYGNDGHTRRRDEFELSEKQLAIVERNPEFPGGTQALYKFLAENIKYPTDASRNNWSGRLYVSFTVNKNGSIRNPQILKGLGWGMDEEVLRAVLNMPQWIPAIQNGKTIAKDFTLPINFALE